jgi:hypothetical protein
MKMCALNKHLLGVYYVPGPELSQGPVNIGVNKAEALSMALFNQDYIQF